MSQETYRIHWLLNLFWYQGMPRGDVIILSIGIQRFTFLPKDWKLHIEREYICSLVKSRLIDCSENH